MQKITSELFAAHQHCPLKVFYLNRKIKGSVSEYNQIIQTRKENRIKQFIEKLDNDCLNHHLEDISKLKFTYDIQIHGTLVYQNLSADFAVLEKADKRHYIPIILTGTHSINKYHKLELFWIAHVLGKLQKETPSYGKINTLSKSVKTKISNPKKVIHHALEEIQDIIDQKEPPPIILNKHCKVCEYQQICRKQAEQEDNLSLLDRVTPKMISQYERKGIFTVKQLSYLFKPPKKSKKLRQVIKHRPEIQALAIRSEKIYLQHKPEVEKMK